MALATQEADGPLINIVPAGGIVSTEPLSAHNVYLPANTIIHTVKHGRAEPNDWHAFQQLDASTKRLSEAEILAMGHLEKCRDPAGYG